MSVLWCLSGIVMMYVPYPRLTEARRVRGLPTIDWRGCCALPNGAGSGTRNVAGFRVEMLGSRPALALRLIDGSLRLFDLVTGSSIDPVPVAEARQMASAYADQISGRRTGSQMAFVGTVDRDQWTVSGEFSKDRPLYKFSVGDATGTELYVSSSSGKVVQATTQHDRLWNWFGAIPHWLYFVGLRRHVALWSAIIIWAAIAGCFLTATGLYVGVRQLRRAVGARWSSYRGFNLWHHLLGLIFGIFSLTWVASGLLSMNPWGLLEGASAEPDRARLRGEPLSSAEVVRSIESVANQASDRELVSVESVPLAGRDYLIAHNRAGARLRLDGDGAAAPLSESELRWIGQKLSGGPPVVEPELVAHDDAYFFRRQGADVSVPFYRLVLNDDQGTRYYLDGVSGAVIAKLDASAKAYRWLHQGLHRFDFSPAMRSRPIWDIVVLFLMAGVTPGTITGTYLGLRRILGKLR